MIRHILIFSAFCYFTDALSCTPCGFQPCEVNSNIKSPHDYVFQYYFSNQIIFLEVLRIFFIFDPNFSNCFPQNRVCSANFRVPKIMTEHLCRLWQYWLWSYKSKNTKLVRFKPKNKCVQRKLL